MLCDVTQQLEGSRHEYTQGAQAPAARLLAPPPPHPMVYTTGPGIDTHIHLNRQVVLINLPSTTMKLRQGTYRVGGSKNAEWFYVPVLLVARYRPRRERYVEDPECSHTLEQRCYVLYVVV